MKAVLFPGDARTAIEEREAPEPGPNEVVIQLTRSGVCGTDVHYWHEPASARADRAHVVPGHETVGKVSAAGPGVTRFQVGDRVVAGMLHIGCGHCRVCRSGEFALCPDKEVFGRTLGGSYAEFVRAPDRAIYHLPEEVPDDVAVLVACNLSTAYSALRRGQVGPGDEIAVLGLGGVGLCTVLVAHEWGARITAVDPIESRRDLAAGLGAHTIVSPDELDGMMASGFGVDAALECSGHPAAESQSIQVLNPGGRAVVVGMGGRYDFAAEDLIRRKATLIGTLVCRPDEFYDVLEFARGHVDELRRLLGPTMTIDQVDDALRHAESGGRGKVVFDWTQDR